MDLASFDWSSRVLKFFSEWTSSALKIVLDRTLLEFIVERLRLFAHCDGTSGHEPWMGGLDAGHTSGSPGDFCKNTNIPSSREHLRRRHLEGRIGSLDYIRDVRIIRLNACVSD
jgi:hypothetical protein